MVESCLCVRKNRIEGNLQCGGGGVYLSEGLLSWPTPIKLEVGCVAASIGRDAVTRRVWRCMNGRREGGPVEHRDGRRGDAMNTRRGPYAQKADRKGWSGRGERTHFQYQSKRQPPLLVQRRATCMPSMRLASCSSTSRCRSSTRRVRSSVVELQIEVPETADCGERGERGRG